LTDRATLRKIYEEGTGSIKVQGEWKVEELPRGRRQIVITSIPYGVDKGKLEADIGAIIEERKLPQVIGLANETNDKEGMRIVLELKPGTDPNLVMAYLYRHTSLQENYAYNMTCLIPGPNNTLRPERLGLKAILRHFLDFRFATVTRRFEYELAQLRRRIHILEGFRVIFNALDEALRLIRESKGKSDAAEKLTARFKLDAAQAEAVLDAQIYKIAQMEVKKILDELKEKKQQAKEIEEILGSKRKLWGVIKKELTALGEKFSARRRTRMAGEEDVLEFDPEAYIVRENANVVLTRDGWVKRVGRLASVESTRVREGDEVVAVVPGSTLDHVVFFADDGTAYTMRVNEVPATTGYGEPIGKFFKLGDGVKIISAVTTDERFTPAEVKGRRGEVPGPYVLAVTAQGMTLRTPLLPFRTASTRTGRRYVRLAEGDRVVFAGVPRDETGVMVASAAGRVAHFPIEQVSVLAGAGKGVLAIRLERKDVLLGAALISGRFDALVVETSGGRTLELRRGAHPPTNRGGKGTEVVKRASLVRVLPPPVELPDWDKIEGGSRNGEKHRNGDGQRNLFE
ncbi:MAG TPA: DNA gyrase subunit A, partial [Gemmataceae bacterium]